MNGKTQSTRQAKAQAIRNAIAVYAAPKGVAFDAAPKGVASGQPTYKKVGGGGGALAAAGAPRPAHKQEGRKGESVGSRGVGVMAGLGSQSRQGVGATTSRSRPGTLGPSLTPPKQWHSAMSRLLQAAVTPLSEEIAAPVAMGGVMTEGSELPKLAPNHREGKHGEVIYEGSELLQAVTVPPAIGGAASSVPQGGVFCAAPLNPMFVDGSRASLMMQQYDQFCLEFAVVEFVSSTNATRDGMLIMCQVNDPEDSIGSILGFAALRDAMARPGATAAQVWVSQCCGQNQPLLKWYYTGRNDDADFTIPGQVYVLAGTDFANASAVPVPLGLIWLHYRLRLRSASIEGPLAQSFSLEAASLSMTAASQTVAAPVVVAAAGTGLPAPQRDPTAVYWATVVSADDVAAGGAGWRTWTDPASNEQRVIGPGNLIYWRVHINGSLSFYPNIAAAMEQNGNLTNAYLSTTVTAPGVVRGFKVMNIQGSNALGLN